MRKIALRDQKAYFQSHPPRLLTPFGFERIDHPDLGGGGGHGEPIAVHYAVSCLCGSSELTLSAIHEAGRIDVAPKPEGWGISISGELTSIWLDCPACRARHINTGGQMKCGACGAPIAQPTPPRHVSDYRAAVFKSSPVNCLCAACGRDEVLFDLGRHGSDAEAGYAPPRAEGERKSLEPLSGDRLVVSLYFPDDLLDAALDRPEDRFTWIAFSRVGRHVISMIDFECA